MKKYLTIGIAVVVLLLLFTLYSDYKERRLDDVIIYNPSTFHSFSFRLQGNEEWKTDQKEPAEELIEFISQYRVKKMKNDEWDSNVSEEKGFEVSIISNDKPVSAVIYEDRIHLYSYGYYSIINGPIDMDWIQNYNKEYQQE